MSQYNDAKRILKNTLFLYFRMLVVLAVSFYTSRIVLESLGVEGFGVYNIVAGIIVLFSFINEAMTSASQRFLNYELGKGNRETISKVFSMSVTVHFITSLLLFAFGETLGLWFFYSFIQIPKEFADSAFFVYQCSLLSAIVGILIIPYNALIVAYEKMSFYAYISIIEVALKLGAALLLIEYGENKLELYAALVLIAFIIIGLLKVIYCRLSFDVSKYKFDWSKTLFIKLTSFSSWSLFGSIANVLRAQGINALINIFSGVIANAAFGIASQVSNGIYQFVSNFQMAFKPHLMKLYAENKASEVNIMIFSTAKFSFFLVLFIALPVLINTDFVLKFWLGIVPEYSSVFVKWVIVAMLIDTLSAPLWMTVQSTGNIRNYQLIITIITMMNFPLALILLYMNFSPVWAVASKTLIVIIALIWRIDYVGRIMNFKPNKFLTSVVFRCGFVSLFSVATAYSTTFFNFGELLSFVISSIVSAFAVLLFATVIGTTSGERKIFSNIISSKLHLKSAR